MAIHKVLQRLPQLPFLYLASFSEAAEGVPQLRALRRAVVAHRPVVLLPSHQLIEAESYGNAHYYHQDSLGVDGAAA